MPKHAMVGTTIDASWLAPQERADWATYLTRAGNPAYVTDAAQLIILGTRTSLAALLEDELGLDPDMAADHLRREQVIVGVGLPSAVRYAPRHLAVDFPTLT